MVSFLSPALFLSLGSCVCLFVCSSCLSACCRLALSLAIDFFALLSRAGKLFIFFPHQDFHYLLFLFHFVSVSLSTLSFLFLSLSSTFLNSCRYFPSPFFVHTLLHPHCLPSYLPPLLFNSFSSFSLLLSFSFAFLRPHFSPSSLSSFFSSFPPF